MFLAIVTFVLGLIIATVINRWYPRIIVETRIEEVQPDGGVYITNDQFITLINDVAIRVPECKIRFNHNKVFFVNNRTGEVSLLTLKRGWSNLTNNTRPCTKQAFPAQEEAILEPPPGY